MLGFKKNKPQEITFDRLRTDDKLIINTKHCQYEFKVLDPAHKYGILSGGKLGAQEYEAFFISANYARSEQFDETSIKPNTKAQFLLQGQDGVKRFCTSPIINLQLLRLARTWKTWLKTFLLEITAICGCY